MRRPRRISRYVGREICVHGFLAFLAAAPIVLAPNLAARLDEFLVIGLTLADAGAILRCVAPLVLGYALPVSFLFGLLLALGRLAVDGELHALRASGLGARALLAPALAVALGVATASAWLVVHVEPHAKRELTAIALRLASRGGVIDVGRFQRFGERLVFARARADERRLEGVLIRDWSDAERPFLLFAEAADFSFDDRTGRVRLALRNGELRPDSPQAPEAGRWRLSFGRFDYDFALLPLLGERWPLWPDQLGVRELREALARAREGEPLRGLRFSEPRYYEAQLHRMAAVPLTPVLFAPLGVALGLRGRVGSRGRALGAALLILGAYYGLFVFAQEAIWAGRIPAVALWLPNAILAALGAALGLSSRRVPDRT